jgi:CheY-like chemotaxis protein
MLEDLGCEVQTSTNAEMALNILSSEPEIEVLLTDVNMPGVDGRQLAFRAKQMRPELQVLLLSGRDQDGYGFPIVHKPFLQSDLRRVMSASVGLC